MLVIAPSGRIKDAAFLPFLEAQFGGAGEVAARSALVGAMSLRATRESAEELSEDAIGRGLDDA